MASQETQPRALKAKAGSSAIRASPKLGRVKNPTKLQQRGVTDSPKPALDEPSPKASSLSQASPKTESVKNIKMGEQRQSGSERQPDAKASGSGTGAMAIREAVTKGAKKVAESTPVQKARDVGEDIQGRIGEVKDNLQSTATGAASELPEAPLDVKKGAPLDLTSLEGLEVGEGGNIQTPDGVPIARVIEGDPEDLVGQIIGRDGEILDEDGDLIGRVELLPQTATEVVGSEPDITTSSVPTLPQVELKDLADLPITDEGNIQDQAGRVIGRLVEGDPSQLVGATANEDGEILDDEGDLIGRIEAVVPEAAGEAAQVAGEVPEISILNQKSLTEEGKVLDESGQVIGQLVEGQDVAAAAGKFVKEQGQVVDEDDTVVGQVEVVPGEASAAAIRRLREEPEHLAGAVQEVAQALPDISTLEGLTCNKLGSIVTADGTPVGELVEGDPKKISREGFQLDDQGQFWNYRGKVVGRARPIPVEDEELGPFAGLGELAISEEGWVLDQNGDRVGKLVEGDAKKLVGHAVDDDGDILDTRGNPLGRAERWEEPEAEEEHIDFSSVEGLKPNKQGNVMGPDQVPIARVVSGNLKDVTGRAIDKDGQIWNDKGEVIGQVQLIPEEEQEAQRPFGGMTDLIVNALGLVEDVNDHVVGRIIEGDPKELRGKSVDEDGEIQDQHGNVIGRAEPYEPPEEEEEEEEDLSALEGLTVNKLGNVVDVNGEVVGRLVAGNAKKLAGKKLDKNGQVWNEVGKVVGQAELVPPSETEGPEGIFSGMDGLTLDPEGQVVDLAGHVVGRLVDGDVQRLTGRTVDEDGEILDKAGNVVGRAERWTPQLSPEERSKQEKEQEDAALAKKMCVILQQTLDAVGPLCRQIMQHIEKANHTPKDELDEEQLVKDVEPLIREAGDLLQEGKGALRALDPDGQMEATAKARSASHDATPEEHQLADLMRELTQTVVETIEQGRDLIADMPHARKQINPLWALLSEPLFQIIAAVGLLLSGVLGLVGKLLNGLGLGGLLQGLLGSLGIDKVLEGFGLGTITEGLGLGGKK